MFLPIQNLMALNKKYNHKIWSLQKTIPEIDAYYPIILPTMDKVSAQLWEKIISWKMFAQHTKYREHKNFVPLIFFSHNALAYNDCLKGKNRLPIYLRYKLFVMFLGRKKCEKVIISLSIEILFTKLLSMLKIFFERQKISHC